LRGEAACPVKSALAGCPYGSYAVLGALAQAAVLHGVGCLLLGDDFPSVELNQHGAVGLDLFDRDGEAEVVEEEELQFQVIELR